VLVGCATVAASPVSWTHHQFWTVLAAMVMVAGPAGVRRAAGGVLLVSMTVNLTDVVARLRGGDHALFIAANMRGLAAAAVCVLGFGAVAGARVAAVRSVGVVERTRIWVVPSRRVLGALAVGGLLFAIMPLPPGADTSVRVATPTEALRLVWSGVRWCPVGTQAEGCAVVPLFPGLSVNYSVGYDSAGAEVRGIAADSVDHLDYLPAPGLAPVRIPLTRAQAGVRVFAFNAVDPAYAQLRVYDSYDHLLGDYGGKLRA
jgi:alpha-1,2-mannosyltransferase